MDLPSGVRSASYGQKPVNITATICGRSLNALQSKSEIRLMGNKSDLLRTLTVASSVGAAANGVRSFVPKWRTRHDSNVRPSPSEGDALSS